MVNIIHISSIHFAYISGSVSFKWLGHLLSARYHSKTYFLNLNMITLFFSFLLWICDVSPGAQWQSALARAVAQRYGSLLQWSDVGRCQVYCQTWMELLVWCILSHLRYKPISANATHFFSHVAAFKISYVCRVPSSEVQVSLLQKITNKYIDCFATRLDFNQCQFYPVEIVYKVTNNNMNSDIIIKDSTGLMFHKRRLTEPQVWILTWLSMRGIWNRSYMMQKLIIAVSRTIMRSGPILPWKNCPRQTQVVTCCSTGMLVCWSVSCSHVGMVCPTKFYPTNLMKWHLMFGGWTGDATGSIEQSWKSLDNMSPPSEEKVHATSIPSTSGAHPSKSPTAKVSSREFSSSTTSPTPSNLQSLASTPSPTSSSSSPLTMSKKSKTLKGTKSPTMKHTKSPTARPSSPTTIKYGSNDATMTMTNAYKVMLEQGILISSDATVVTCCLCQK